MFTNICMVLSKLITVILYYFTSHLELEVTEWNCIRNSVVSMWDINSSLIVLLIYGTLYLQQSFLATCGCFWTKSSQVDVQQLYTLLLIICVYVCLCILCRVFFCDVSGRLVLFLLINWLMYVEFHSPLSICYKAVTLAVQRSWISDVPQQQSCGQFKLRNAMIQDVNSAFAKLLKFCSTATRLQW